MARMSEDRLRFFHGLIIGNKFGYVQLLQPINLLDLDLNDAVFIDKTTITAYAPLNSFKARVVLHDISNPGFTYIKDQIENADIVKNVLRSMYEIIKEQYDEDSHEYWFVAQSLQEK